MMYPRSAVPNLVPCNTKSDFYWAAALNCLYGLLYIAFLAIFAGFFAEQLSGSRWLNGAVTGIFFFNGSYYWCRFVLRGGLLMGGSIEDVKKLP